MRYLIYLTGLVLFFSVTAQAEEETTEKAPVYEPITQDINARLDRLEQAVNNQALLDMLDMLESLKLDVSKLTGELEVQTHTIEQLKQRQRDLYTDIDQRLQRIETGKSVISAEDNPSPVDNLVAEGSTETEDAPAEENVETETAAATETDSDEVSEEKPDPLMAEAEYQRAFKLLKESRYEQAIESFKKFLKDYPNSDFSDNAQYWLGETNYVMQKYELAINEYQALLNTYPDSQKVSHALLKIGYSYAELGNNADAKKTLNEVKKQYPGTTAARLADERLRKINSSNESNS